MLIRLFRDGQARDVDAPLPLKPFFGLAVFHITERGERRDDLRGFWRVEWYQCRTKAGPHWIEEYDYLQTNDEPEVCP